MTPDKEPKPGERRSIWTVSKKYMALYMGLFITYAVAALTYLTFSQIRMGRVPLDIITYMIQATAPATGSAAAMALLTIETPRSVEMLANYIKQELLEPLKRRQRQEGHREADRIWREWNQRRTEAKAQGQPFDEPPPGQPESD